MKKEHHAPSTQNSHAPEMQAINTMTTKKMQSFNHPGEGTCPVDYFSTECFIESMMYLTGKVKFCQF